MKNKKLWLIIAAAVLALALLAAGVLALGSCQQEPGETVGTEAPEPAVQVTISQTSAKIGVGGSLYLTAEAVNTQENIVWASSDEEIATVKNGEVTGIREGTAIISASVGSAVAECTVTVSMDAPVLLLNRQYVAVAPGGSYTLQAQVTGAEETDITYQWVGLEGCEQVATLVPAEDTSSAVVTGVAYGDTEYFVTTTVGGVTLTKKITVVCCNIDITFGVEGKGVTPAIGGFDVRIELGTPLRPAVSVFNKGQKVDGAKLVWSSKDSSIAAVNADGTITGMKEGYTVITCRYGEENNYVNFFVSVYRPIYQMDTHYVLEGAAGTLTVTDKLVGTVQGITVNGRSIFGSVSGSTITFKAGAFPSDPALMGEGRPLVIHTDRAQYVYSASVYSKIIKTAGEFKAMASYLKRSQGDNNWAQYTGYVVLGNDIDLAGEAFEMFVAEPWSGSEGGTDYQVNSGFNGIFDGRGYAVKNYTATAGNNALFTTVGNNGMIRNVSFQDISAPATCGNILTRVINGGMSNVYISISSWDNGAVLAHSYRVGRTLSNVVIEYTGPAIEGVRDVVGHWGTPPTYFTHYPPNIKNVYVVGNITTMETNCAEHGSGTGCGFHVYKDVAALKAAGHSLAGFSGTLWNVSSGVPVPKDLYKERATQKITVTNTENIISAGDTVTLAANADYVTWSLDKAPAGVTLKGNVLTIGSKASLGQVQVTATNVYNKAQKDSYTLEVVKMAHQKLASVGDLELNRTKGQTAVTLDLSKATAYKEIVGIKIGAREIPIAGQNTKSVTVNTADLKALLGKQVDIVLTCKTSGGYNKVTLPATVVSKVITTAEQFKAMADYMDRTEGDNNWTQYTGFVVLGGDIDLAGAAFELFAAEPWSGEKGGDDNKANLGFNGIFDGRGYAVKNYTATAGNNALFTTIGINGCICNVSLLDITAPDTAGNILTRLFNGRIKDTYISIKDWQGGGLLAHSYRDGRFLENVVVEYTGEPIVGLRDVTGHWGDANYFVHYPTNIQNVYIIGNISQIITNCQEHGTELPCGFHVYTTMAQMKADGNDYSAFNKDVWSTAAGIPVPQRLYSQWKNTDIKVTNKQVAGSYELIRGTTMELTANVPYVAWELVGNTDKQVTLSGNKLTAGKNAAAAKVTVKATNLYNSAKSVQITVLLATGTNKTLPKLPNLEVLGQTHAYVDLQESSVLQITDVTVDGSAVAAEHFDLEGTRLKLAASQLAAYCGKGVTLEISYKTPQASVVATCQVELVVSKVVRTFEDLKLLNSVATPNLDGYFILGNDIDCKSQSIAAGSTPGWVNTGFKGIFDGKGYAISNLKLGNGADYAGLFGTVSGGTIRNVTFDNVVFNSRAGLFGRFLYNKAGTDQKTAVENVTVNISGWASGATECGVFTYTTMANTSFKNVTINVADNVKVGNLLGGGFNKSNVTGSIVVNLGVGSSIALYHDSSNVKPDIVTVNQIVAEKIDTLVAGEGTTKVSFTHKDFGVGSVKVAINGQSKTLQVTQSGKLAVDLNDFGVTKLGQYAAVISLGDSTYTYTNVWYVTKVIDTVAELKALGADAKNKPTGYYILGADIDCSAQANMSSGNPGWAIGFGGTFDGLGHKISNIKLAWDNATGGYGGLFGTLTGATVRNVTFENVNYAGANVALLGRMTLEGNGQNTQLENVAVSISGWSATGECGVFVSRSSRNTIYNNVTVDVAANVKISNFFGQEFNPGSNVTTNGTGVTATLGTNSAITAYYWSGTAASTAVTAKPAVLSVSAPVSGDVNTLVAGEGTTTVTFNHSGLTVGTASVTINKVTKDVAITQAGKLTVNLKDFGVTAMGQYSAAIAVGKTSLTYSQVWYVTKVIDTVAELKALGADAKNKPTGYYILGADIDCSAQANMSSGNPGWAVGFGGTFDGRDHKISNIKLSWDNATQGYGGLFGTLTGATVKNVTFDKVNYASAHVALLGRMTLEGNGKNTQLENVTVNISAWAASGECGVFVSRSSRNTIYNNVKVNVAANVTISNFFGQEFNPNNNISTNATGVEVTLGQGSSITAYYWTGTAATTAVTTAPGVFKRKS